MDGIIKRIRALDASVAAKVDEVVNRNARKGEAALRDAIFTELKPVCAEAFELSSQLAQAVYNGWRTLELGEASETVAADVFDQEKFDDMAYTAVSKAKSGEAANVIKSYAGFNIRDAYARSLFASAANDKRKPRFARVPQGPETCRFCIMLASRGFTYASGKSGNKVHNHANCDCIYVASWDKNPKAAGYDPDYYYDVYRHPEDHPEIRDAINARRRELYAIKKTSTGGSVSVDVDKIVPCLEDARTGEILKTNVSRMTKSDLKGYNIRTGWGANWQKKASLNEVYALRIDGSDEVHGLVAVRAESGANAVYIDFAKAAPHSDPTMVKEKRYNGIGGHLFAIAAKRSEQLGYDGAIYGDAANKELLNLYERKFGAINIPIFHIYRFIIEPKDALAILDEYSFDWKG